jgi:ATP-dependent Clp protease adaptor protein ClpS
MAEEKSNAAVATAPAPAKPKPDRKNQTKKLPPYHVVLLNDDDHSYAYVIDMLGKLFGYSAEKAFTMADKVDHEGRVIVYTTHKELAELKRDQIHAFGGDVRIARSKGSMSAVIEPAAE